MYCKVRQLTCSKVLLVFLQGCCRLRFTPRGDGEVLLPCLAYCEPADVGVVAPLLPAHAKAASEGD